ncbi:MAG TPA: hypothetical protein VE222_11600 [Nitrospiraceae bacterium]|jgi:hypothetical protein|nr:hypothetical protein [Nitrospiraceae bacterium]
MYRSMIEARKPIKIVARAFKGPDGQWGVMPGAVVFYATEKTKSNAEMILCQSIDTGEIRPTYEGIVKWLEEKARRGVKEALHLDEQETMKLVIEPTIKIEP